MGAWNTGDIPAQNGRVAIVTGANAGLGFETAAALSTAGAHVVLAVRNPDEGRRAADRINALSPGADTDVQPLDLASLASIRTGARDLATRYPRIDLLINNAGIMYPRGRHTTADGFESQFGTNHLGHFALTALLLDNLMATDRSRIVTVSSIAHRAFADIHFEDLQWQRTYRTRAAYAQSKLANLLFTYELAHRLRRAKAPTLSVAAHPGISNTGLTRSVTGLELRFSRAIGQSPTNGALPQLRAATDPNVLPAQYYGPGGLLQARGKATLVASTRKSHDVELQRRLWTASEELTGVTYGIT